MMNPLVPGAAPAANALAAPQRSGPMMHPDPSGFIRGMNLHPSVIAKEAAASTYAAQEFGKLARNPDVTHKDVINSAGQAVADGQITPTQAVGMLSEVPQDPDKLKGWLDQQYANHLTAAVHLKAIMMGAAQPAPVAPAAPMGAAQPAPMPNAAPAPGAAPEPVATGA